MLTWVIIWIGAMILIFGAMALVPLVLSSKAAGELRKKGWLK